MPSGKPFDSFSNIMLNLKPISCLFCGVVTCVATATMPAMLFSLFYTFLSKQLYCVQVKYQIVGSSYCAHGTESCE